MAVAVDVFRRSIIVPGGEHAAIGGGREEESPVGKERIGKVTTEETGHAGDKNSLLRHKMEFPSKKKPRPDGSASGVNNRLLTQF